jgi:hypothetical protein
MLGYSKLVLPGAAANFEKQMFKLATHGQLKYVRQN